MKSNKGFTLVEVLAVLVVLSLIMLIVIPSIQNVLSSSKEQINTITKNNLRESAKLLGQEVYMCDNNSNVTTMLKELLDFDALSCNQARELLNSSGITVTIGFLKENDYFNDKGNMCEESGKLTIKEVNGKIKVEFYPDIKCKK